MLKFGLEHFFVEHFFCYFTVINERGCPNKFFFLQEIIFSLISWCVIQVF